MHPTPYDEVFWNIAYLRERWTPHGAPLTFRPATWDDFYDEKRRYVRARCIALLLERGEDNPEQVIMRVDLSMERGSIGMIITDTKLSQWSNDYGRLAVCQEPPVTEFTISDEDKARADDILARWSRR